jgi:hypothetical protein
MGVQNQLVSCVQHLAKFVGDVAWRGDAGGHFVIGSR